LTKKNRQLLITLALLLLLGSGYLILGMKGKEEASLEQQPPAPRESYTLTETGESDLESLTVRNSFGENTFIDRDGLIAVQGQPDIILNQQAALSLVYSLGNIKSYERIEESVAEPGQYGLDEPSASAVLKKKDGSSTVIHLGISNPSKSGYYAFKEGDSAVYLLNSYLGSTFLNSLDLLRDRTLPTVNLQNLKRLTIRRERTIDIVPYFPYEVFSSTLSPFLMVKPYRRPVAVNTQTYSESLEALSGGYSIGRFITGSEAESAGISGNSPEIYLLDGEGNEVTITTGNTSDQGEVYCRVSSIEGIVTLPSDALKILHQTPLDFADKFVRLIGIDNIKEVRVEAPGESWTGTVHWLDSERDRGEFTFQGAAVEEDPFKKMYQEILYLLYEGEIPGDFKPSGTPGFKVTYTGNEDSPGQTAAEFFDYNQDYYAVSIDGYPPEFLIGKYQIENLKTYLRDFK